MTPRSFVIAAACFALLQPAAVPLQAQSGTPATPVSLARAGKGAEAWKMWSALPSGAPKLRTGVEVAAVLKEIDRGLELYGQLRSSGDSTEIESLRALALATAADVQTSKDPDAKITACAAALRILPTNEPCRGMLETMASKSQNIGEQALGAYALADAGLRPFPGLFTSIEQNLSAQLRIQFAGRFIRLPAAERLSMLRPVLTNPDVSLQYQAVLSLGLIQHPDVLPALRNIEPMASPVRLARLVSLALHRDPISLQSVAEALPNLDNYLKVPASLALAQAGDARGTSTLVELMNSPVDLQRLLAAEAVIQLNPEAAVPTILDALTKGSPAIKPAALKVAGLARLGDNAAVYLALGGTDPVTRAQAVDAIATTLTTKAPAPVPTADPFGGTRTQ